MNWQTPQLIKYDLHELSEKIKASALSTGGSTSCNNCSSSCTTSCSPGACHGCTACWWLFVDLIN